MALPTELPHLRWQPRERWHITVAFLGDRDAGKEVGRLQRLVPPAPEPIRLHSSGTFGPVLWVGVETGVWLPQLAASAKQLFGVDERRFRAHVTVARARDSAGRRELSRAQQHVADFASSQWQPDELTLVRSVTGPHPSYEVIGRKPLSAP